VGRREPAVEAVGVDPAFWSGRRVLVTGHSGFKGSWLTLWLAEMGAEVSGFSAPLGRGRSLFELARVGEVTAGVHGDIRDADSVTRAVADAEVVLHLAAQPIVRRSYVDPAETYEINVMGTVNVLEAARASDQLRSVVVVTSDKCYLNTGLEHAYREDDPLGGADPYSSSKAVQELVAAAYRESFGLPLATARAGNVIGGGDFGQDRLVPDAMRAALDGRSVEVRNPRAVRPWQHVLNPLAGYLQLAQNPAAGPAFNFGPSAADARPVGDIVNRLAELWPGGLEQRDASDPDAPHEAGYLHIDSTRAHEVLGWQPRWDLDEALRAVIQWHAAHADGQDMREVTVGQIREYMANGSR
jgi:CDP-glucose 4,6-dehydratase